MSSGGARPGAGRKALPPGEKMVQMVVTVDAETKELIKARAKANKLTPGRYIARLVALSK